MVIFLFTEIYSIFNEIKNNIILITALVSIRDFFIYTILLAGSIYKLSLLIILLSEITKTSFQVSKIMALIVLGIRSKKISGIVYPYRKGEL